jgi:microcystin-dependent protein
MDGYLAEIRIWAATFAPRNWAFCQGQILAISQNTALFSLLGTTYGGDGRTTFALPDLRGRVPVGVGNGPGLTNRSQGQKGGTESVTLTEQQIPSHTHTAASTLSASASEGTAGNPAGNLPAASREMPLYSTSANLVQMDAGAIDTTVANAGGSQSHTNMQPHIGLHYIICLQGIFPSRS